MVVCGEGALATGDGSGALPRHKGLAAAPPRMGAQDYKLKGGDGTAAVFSCSVAGSQSNGRAPRGTGCGLHAPCVALGALTNGFQCRVPGPVTLVGSGRRRLWHLGNWQPTAAVAKPQRSPRELCCAAARSTPLSCGMGGGGGRPGRRKEVDGRFASVCVAATHGGPWGGRGGGGGGRGGVPRELGAGLRISCRAITAWHVVFPPTVPMTPMPGGGAYGPSLGPSLGRRFSCGLHRVASTGRVTAPLPPREALCHPPPPPGLRGGPRSG